MSRLPAKAILDYRKGKKERQIVEVLQSPKKDYFDILVVRKNGKERRMFVHRSRLKFIPGPRTPRPADTICASNPPAREQVCLQDELPLG